jgi:hypothetical protein
VALLRAGRVAACGRPEELIEYAGLDPAARHTTLDDAIVALTTEELSTGDAA